MKKKLSPQSIKNKKTSDKYKAMNIHRLTVYAHESVHDKIKAISMDSRVKAMGEE